MAWAGTGSQDQTVPGVTATVRLGLALRRLRQERGLSQRRLAGDLNLAAHSSIVDYEAGRRIPPEDILAAYERLFEQPSGELRQLRHNALCERARKQEAQALAPAGRSRARPSCDAARFGCVPAELPADLPDFVGRGEELRYAIRIVAGAAASIVLTVCGQPGVGKTAFTVHLGYLLKDRFPDGQIMVDLHGFDEHARPARDALRMLLESLGLQAKEIPPGLEERSSLYRSVVANRRMLIVADNARDERQVRPLLPGGDRCLTLVTSRNLLPGLEASGCVMLDVLTMDCSVELLGHIAGPGRIAAELTRAQDVARACGRLPLALRVAGARLASRPGWTVAHLAQRLDHERDLLNELSAGDLGVRSALDLSYRMLLPAHRQVFRRLAILPGRDFTPEPAAAVSDLTAAQAGRVLEHLVDRNVIAAAGERRYRFHDLIRAYAAEQAHAEDGGTTLRAALIRALTWYLHTAAAADKLLIPDRRRIAVGQPGPGLPPPPFGSRDEALHWCDAERANLVAAVRQAARYGLHDIAWQLPASLRSFFEIRGLWGDWAATHRTGVRSARKQGERTGEAWLLNSLGTAHHQMLRLDKAISCHTQAVAAYRDAGDRAGEASALNNLGCVYGDVHRYRDAVACLREAAAVRHEIADEAAVAVTLSNLGDTHCQMGRYYTAVGYLRQSLDIHRRTGSAYSEAITLHSLGDAYRQMGGQAGQALTHLEQALAMLRKLGNRYGEAIALESLGETWRDLGQQRKAMDHWAEAIAIFTAIGHPRAAQLRQRVAAEPTAGGQAAGQHEAAAPGPAVTFPHRTEVDVPLANSE